MTGPTRRRRLRRCTAWSWNPSTGCGSRTPSTSAPARSSTGGSRSESVLATGEHDPHLGPQVEAALPLVYRQPLQPGPLAQPGQVGSGSSCHNIRISFARSRSARPPPSAVPARTTRSARNHSSAILRQGVRTRAPSLTRSLPSPRPASAAQWAALAGRVQRLDPVRLVGFLRRAAKALRGQAIGQAWIGREVLGAQSAGGRRGVLRIHRSQAVPGARDCPEAAIFPAGTPADSAG
jgi:hypothetical protein